MQNFKVLVDIIQVEFNNLVILHANSFNNL
jgi:hypothetical protein